MKYQKISTISPTLTFNTPQVFQSVSNVTSSSRFYFVIVLGTIPAVRRKSALLIFRSMSDFRDLLQEMAIWAPPIRGLNYFIIPDIGA